MGKHQFRMIKGVLHQRIECYERRAKHKRAPKEWVLVSWHWRKVLTPKQLKLRAKKIWETRHLNEARKWGGNVIGFKRRAA